VTTATLQRRPARRPARLSAPSAPDPLWYKDAVIYEVHVRAFRDSNGDGKGDFVGLTSKLDYLQDLGVTAIWILPFYPSPLRDDGYDIADYEAVNPDYGTLRDVRTLIREAHRRGLRVITELVCNHTSDQHPWFQRARRARPGSAQRDFYVWSDTADKYRDARIIFKDFETSNWSWDPVARAYYWHRFYAHQPDLNFENPRVQAAILKTMDYWLDMGVDGLRLDAIPYLYEREGTNCENLPETHAFLRDLRAHIDQRFGDRMLLAEANQWPEDSVAYFGAGDECHMAFHFPVMPRMFMAIRREDRYPIVDILGQTPPIPDTAQWALFLRNHDELTLEMVTDEERDYMYRAYASDPQARINLGIRRRLAPLLGNNRRRIELMNGLLFALPGTPVLYYGDEIGMGDNVFLGDRNGVRTPMQWSGDRNAGFSSANRQQLYLPVITDPEYHYEAINVEAQQANPHSLLWWMKRLIALRKRHRAFGRGSIEFLHPDNRHILAFVRRDADETLLIVANLSRFAQYGELDLSAFEGSRPVELFGQVDFPTVARTPYLLSLGPHSFMWFTLQPPAVESRPFPSDPSELPRLAPVDELADLATAPRAAPLAEILAAWARHRRWFRGKARRIASAQIRDAIPMSAGETSALLLVLGVQFTEGDPEEYLVPLVALPEAAAASVLAETPWAGIARLEGEGDGAGVRILVDAMRVAAFSEVLLAAVAGRRRLRGRRGELAGQPTRAFRALRGEVSDHLTVTPSRAEQSNSSVIFGDRLILKLYRRLDAGLNPDLEVSAFLTERGFAHVPTVAGSLDYRAPGSGAAAAIVQAFVPNEGDVWEVTLDDLGDYLERALIAGLATAPGSASAAALLERADDDAPRPVQESIGSYLGTARLLGTRTGELHLALASDRDNPAFAPEPFSALYQRSLHQSVRTTIGQTLRFLSRRVDSLPERARDDARTALSLDAEADDRLSGLLDRRIGGARIRCHGDLHLGQILYTGRDIAFIDFEGEPGRPLSERRLKRSALTDVAGMIRSFHYAASGALLRLTEAGAIPPADALRLDGWAQHWYVWVAAAFLAGYRTAVAGADFLPGDPDEWAILLDALLLQKAFYELSYELNNRPEWVSIPLQGIVSLLRD
jgi:maltose alpha-D-glucosyltransferase / alpha-amylase